MICNIKKNYKKTISVHNIKQPQKTFKESSFICGIQILFLKIFILDYVFNKENMMSILEQ